MRLGTEGVSTPKSVKRPDLGDIKWLAGLLEGEGHFQSSKAIQVTMMSADLEVVEKVAAMFGGSINLVRISSKLSKKPCWRWLACGARARGIAMTVYSLMSSRRQSQIRPMLIGAS